MLSTWMIFPSPMNRPAMVASAAAAALSDAVKPFAILPTVVEAAESVSPMLRTRDTAPVTDVRRCEPTERRTELVAEAAALRVRPKTRPTLSVLRLVAVAVSR